MNLKCKHCLSFWLAVIMVFMCSVPTVATEKGSEFSPNLQEAIDKANAGEKIPVILWFQSACSETIHERFENEIGMKESQWLASVMLATSMDEIRQIKKKKNDIAKEEYQHFNSSIISQYLQDEEILYSSKFSSVIIARVTINTLFFLQGKKLLECADLYNSTITPASIETQAARIDMSHSMFPYTGTNTYIGIYDIEVPNLENIPPCNCVDTHGGNISGINSSSHAEMMATDIIDIAPDASYWFAGWNEPDRTITNMEHVEWLVDNNVDVINMSLGLGDNTTTYTMLSKWFDHISYQHYVTFVIAVGNKQKDDNHNHTILTDLHENAYSYNSLVVGGIDTNHTALNYSDDFQSASTFSTVSSYNLVYKPDLCATAGDSSNSAAIVTGLCALMNEGSFGILLFPERVKSVLTACINRTSPFMYLPKDRTTNLSINSYMQFGAGMIDAFSTMNCLSEENLFWRILSSNDTGAYFTYEATDTSTVRFSLAFTQPVDNLAGNHFTQSILSTYDFVDLDLYVENSNGSIMYEYSTTSGNNIEIVEFTPPSSGTYRIRIDLYNTISPNSNCRMCVAWSN